jgi:ABC-type microcin C transport system duplicated ATPase subunit YejF
MLDQANPGTAQVLGRYPHQLSGGMRQRDDRDALPASPPVYRR